VATFGIAPGDGTFLVAHEVTRATFEALLVVEENAAIARRDEELGRAGNDALAAGTVTAYRVVDNDMSALMNVEAR
tara:strand:+ start:5067 stop:5294 length:228 start_codon:yes stop_codon:yes gene_type:complete